MTKQEKLTKLIDIAVDNGFDKDDGKEWVNMELHELINEHYILLFSHDFAKAIWGDGKKCNICEKHIVDDKDCCDDDYDYKAVWASDGWKEGLRQAVISDDPLEYYWKYR